MKMCLKDLTEIRNETMRMEFKILEVVEKFRILKKYEKLGVQYNEEKYEIAVNLQRLWNKLLVRAKEKDRSLKDKKVTFSAKTKSEINRLKINIASMYEEFVESGPGAIETRLDDGTKSL